MKNETNEQERKCHCYIKSCPFCHPPAQPQRSEGIDPVTGYRYDQEIPKPICDMQQITAVATSGPQGEWEVRPAGSHFPELSYIADGEKLFGTLNKYQANAIADAHNAALAAERERRKPLATANLRLVEALELARKWLPNSLCPTPNEERAYEIIDAALAQAKEQ